MAAPQGERVSLWLRERGPFIASGFVLWRFGWHAYALSMASLFVGGISYQAHAERKAK